MEIKDYEWARRVTIPSEVVEFGLRQTITYRTQTVERVDKYNDMPATVTLVLSNGHVWKGDEKTGVMTQVDVTQYYDKDPGF